MLPLAVVLAVVALGTPGTAEAQDRDRVKSTGRVVAGSVLTGFGGLLTFSALLADCATNDLAGDVTALSTCGQTAGAAGLGAGITTVGVLLLTKWAWVPAPVARSVDGVSVTQTRGGVRLGKSFGW